MNKIMSRNRIALWGVAFVTLVMLALLIRSIIAPSVAPPRSAVSFVAVPADPSTGQDASVASLPEIPRIAVDSVDMCEVVVRNVEGQYLLAQVEVNGKKLQIRGSGWMPASSGEVAISSTGYVPTIVGLRGSRVEVILRPARRVEGVIFDVVTKNRLPGVSVSLEPRVAGEPPLLGKTDSEGQFLFPDTASGSYVLRGAPPGYVPLCTDLGARSSGIPVEVSENLQVDVSAYPVYVTLCGVYNQTNLTNDVFGALVSCVFSQQPGPSLPQWFEHEVMQVIRDKASLLGITNAYGDACCLQAVPASLTGRVEFFFDVDQSRIPKDVAFQSLAEFLHRPEPIWHGLERMFKVGTLIVESPITLRIAESSGIVFGGIETIPGSFAVELPHGNYVVGPLDMHPLLRPEQWTRHVSVPSQGKVTISPAEGAATLGLTGGTEWPLGILVATGRGFSMGIPLKNLPTSMPVSPGSYEFSVLAEPGSQESPVWQGAITLEAGQSKVFTIGNQ